MSHDTNDLNTNEVILEITKHCVGKMSVGEMSVGKMSFDQKAWTLFYNNEDEKVFHVDSNKFFDE